SVEEKTVEHRPLKATSSSRRRSRLRSKTYTSASIPIAMKAAFMPTTPPPITSTVAAATPGTPPSRMPRPPSGFSSMNAPARELRLRREVQVGEQRVPGPQASNLLGLGLLDLQDQLAAGEHLVGVGRD